MRLEKLAKAVVAGYAILSGSLIWLDWLVSTEMEFLSTTPEKVILTTFAVALSLWLWFENKEERRAER